MFKSCPYISVCPSGAGNAIRDKIMLLCSVSSVVCCPADLKILSVQKLRPMYLSNPNINSQWIIPILFRKDNMLMQPNLSNLPTKLYEIFFAFNWSADQKLKTLLTWRAWPVQMVGINRGMKCPSGFVWIRGASIRFWGQGRLPADSCPLKILLVAGA